MKSLTIGNNVKSIGIDAFTKCSSLKTVTIPNSVTSLGSAFISCSSLENITIGNGVTKIATRTFSGCKSLKTVVLGNGIKEIDKSAFTNCTSLEEYIISENNVYFCSVNGVMFNKDKTNLVLYPKGKKNASYIIPESVTTIEELAFYNAQYLNTVNIPETLTTIGKQAFLKCYLLSEISIPDNVTSVGDEAFSNCTSLKSVKLSEAMSSIGYEVFLDCESLNSIIIPDGITEIGSSAFQECTSLTSVHIGSGIKKISDSFDYCKAIKSILISAVNPPETSSSAFNKVKTDIPVYVPAESIESYKKASTWKNFTNFLPINDESHFTIGDITYVTMLNGEVHVSDCNTNVKAVSIPAQVEYNDVTYTVTGIDENAFEGCESLATVTLGSNIKEINDLAFYQCPALKDIIVDNANTYFCSENGILFNKEKDILVLYPVAQTAESYAIPESIKTIGYGAFRDNKSLTSVTISENVILINNSAFENCSSLKEITVEAVYPPSIYENTFYGVEKSIPVYVPGESLEEYKTTEYWKEFTNILSTGLSAVTTPVLPETVYTANGMLCNPDRLTVTVYDLNGRIVFQGNDTNVQLPAGMYIVRTEKSARKVVL